MTWRERIEAAKKRGRFLVRDKQAAEDWRTCAVGEHGELYRTNRDVEADDGEPVGVELYELGIAFTDCVEGDELWEAERIYKRIQTYFRRRAKVKVAADS